MSMTLQIMKFGGTSVGDADCIARTARIINEASRKGSVVTVVSAMSGVTNQLISAAHQSSEGDGNAGKDLANSLLQRHSAALEALIKDDVERARLIEKIQAIIEEARNLCRGMAVLRELTPRTLAAISSIGERLAVEILAQTICELGVRAVAVTATDVIVTDNDYSQAEPLMAETRKQAAERLRPLLSGGITPVVTGFIGATTDGTLTTLGRGGSDYSATILGSALDADQIVIWTDVDGVMTADPRLVPSARLLREISYSEAAELAFYGARVLHPKTLRPVADAGIAVAIRNSFAPERTGTMITRTGRPTKSGVKAITAITDVSLITVGGRGMVGSIGIAAKTFAAAASVRANVLLISQSSSENAICFIVESTDADRTLEALQSTFASDVKHHDVEQISVNPDIVTLAVVGEKMHGTPGIAGRLFTALGRINVNVIAIAQGSSEYNVSFVVNAREMRRAVVAIHDEFKLNERDAEHIGW